MEFRRVLFRSGRDERAWNNAALDRVHEVQAGAGLGRLDLDVAVAERSEERRGGKEGRSRWAWSSDVCSSDLAGMNEPGITPPLIAFTKSRPVPVSAGSISMWQSPKDRKSVVEGKRGDLGGHGVQTCALPIWPG